MLTVESICDKVMRNREGFYIQSLLEFADYYVMLIVPKDEDTSNPYYNWSMVPFVTVNKETGSIINNNVLDLDLPDEAFEQLEIPKRYRRA